jgi:hypothetical protein
MNDIVKDLDPNDPDVYTDPNKVRLLPLAEQMIATINMAQTGQIVNGDPILTLEAILRAAGYDMTMDGQLSAEEQLFLKNFKDKLEDKEFNQTAEELLKVIFENPAQKIVSIIETAKAPELGNSFGNAARTQAIKQLAAKLVSDPD